MSTGAAWLVRLLAVALATSALLAESQADAADDATGAALAAAATDADELALSRQVLVMLRLPAAHFRADGGYTGSYGDAAGGRARRRVAQALAQEHGLQLLNQWPMPVLGVECFVMLAPAGIETAPALDRLNRDDRVAWAQPMHRYTAQASSALPEPSHNDPLYPVQPAAVEWHLARLHQAATGRRVTVAVVDSAVDAHHPDLEGQIGWNENFVPSRPFVAEQHGTAVAGIIAARSDNHLGIAGIAPGARLMALRGCWQRDDGTTACNSLTLAQALQFAMRHDADVINLSLSGPADRLLQALLDAALVRGITVVAAADAAASDGGFPASHGGVLAVTDEQREHAPPHAWRAPGQDVPTTEPGGRWGLVSGTSFASAHVAGLVALQREARGAGAASLRLVAQDGQTIDACASLAPDATCACNCTATSTSGTRTNTAPGMAQ